MIGSKTYQIEYAAKKLYQAGVPFPVDRNDAAYDITAIVHGGIWLTAVEVTDNFSGTIINRRNLQEVLDDVVYNCQFIYGKPVIALLDEDDSGLYYIVYDAEPAENVWPN